MLGVAAATLAVAAWAWQAGGIGVLYARYGLWAPLATVPLHVLTTITPLGELVPMGVVNGAFYGFGRGAALNWGAWMAAAAVQYALGQRLTSEAGGRERLPRWLRRLPLDHPAVLVCGRWFPGGGPLVDASAGALGVPRRRLLLLAGLGHLPQALFLAGVGAGLGRLL
ncbi:MAG: VTT domain-containing protein [Rhodothermales bacterium]|nr:VTT domain-containing protein [Rhodothermales bacterium]